MATDTTKAQIFTKDFLINAFVNLTIYVNYYVLMVVMAAYCLAVYNTSVSLAGFAASIFIVGALFARFLGGGIIDRFGRKRCLLVGAVAMAACCLLYLVPVGLGALLVLRTVHGFAYGIAQTSISSIATEAIPATRKGEGIGYFMLSATLGSAVGPFLGTVVAEYLSYAVLFVLCGVVIALGAVAALATHDLHQPPATVIEAVPGLEEEPLTATSAPTAPAPHSRHHIALSSFVEYRAVPISVVIAIAFLAYGAVITYLNPYADQQNMVQAASLFFVVYSIVMLIARPFTGRAFDLWGDLGVMVIGFVAFAAGMLCMGLAHDGAQLLIAAGLLGLGVGTVNPCGLTLAVQRTPAERLTAANSTYSCLCDLTIGLAPVLLGWLVPIAGYHGLYEALTGVVLAALALYLVFRWRGLLR